MLHRATAFFLLAFLCSSALMAQHRGNQVEVRIKGSDTMSLLVSKWAAGYALQAQHVRIKVFGGGTGPGISALLNGHVDIANASRPMRTSEMNLAKRRFREEWPVERMVAWDAVAVVLNPANPLTRLGISHIQHIFDRKGKVRNWKDLGITVPGCSDGHISRISRRNNSGTRAFFRRAVLGTGHSFTRDIETVQSNELVVAGVAVDPCAIGYVSMAYASDSRIKTVCLGENGRPCALPNVQAAASHAYPLVRPLYMYTRGQPTGKVKAFMDWVVSAEGQKTIEENGYIPLKYLPGPAPATPADDTVDD